MPSITLVNGLQFDPYAPDPSVIDLDVLEHGMNVPRFNNQTIRPITVLEHSCRVRRLVEWMGGDVWAQIGALFHDAPEALVPWGDCLRPGKTAEMRAVEGLVMDSIYTALRLKEPGDIRTRAQTIKQADAIALYFEAMLWQPGASAWAATVLPEEWEDPELHIQNTAQVLPLIAPRPGESWRDEVLSLMPRERAHRSPQATPPRQIKSDL